MEARSLLPIDPDSAAVQELRSTFFQKACHVGHRLLGLDAVRLLLAAENLMIPSMTCQGPHRTGEDWAEAHITDLRLEPGGEIARHAGVPIWPARIECQIGGACFARGQNWQKLVALELRDMSLSRQSVQELSRQVLQRGHPCLKKTQ